MQDEQQLDGGRYRVYPIIGIAVAVVFLALGAAAYLLGGGPVVAIIAVAGGVLTLAVSILQLVRSGRR